MKAFHKSLTVLAFAALCAQGLPAHAGEGPFADRDRTTRRTVAGEIVYPAWLLARPAHYEFLPLTSNHDAHHQHPAQWAGQDWDPAAWGPEFTPERVLRDFFAARIFTRKYVDDKTPVLDVGPRFYTISDLDRRRGLKLLTDQTRVFADGHAAVILRDWKTGKVVGVYDAQRGLMMK